MKNRHFRVITALCALLLVFSLVFSGCELSPLPLPLPGSQPEEADAEDEAPEEIPEETEDDKRKKSSSPEAPEEFADEAEEILEEEEPSFEEAYAAYFRILKDHQDVISDYSWQRYGEPRAVSLLDVCGDDTPELIFVASDEFEGANCSSLRIYGFGDGQAFPIFEQSWDNEVGGGFYYVLFRRSGEKDLYAYQSYGDEWWNYEIARFTETENGIKLLPQLRECIHPNEDYTETVHEYEISGSPAEENVFRAEWDAVVASMDTVVMRKEEIYDFQDLSYLPGYELPIDGMNYREAASFLKGPGRQGKCVIMEHGWQNGMETASLYGLDEDADPVWFLEFRPLEAVQISGYWDYGWTSSGYVVGLDGVICCFDAANGEVIWSMELGRGGGQIDDLGNLYLTLGESGSRIVGIDESGTLLFDKSYPELMFWGEFSFTDDGDLSFSDVYAPEAGLGAATVTMDARSGEILSIE